MEHPENNEAYKGLTVNEGVAQPSIINPYLQRQRVRRRQLSAAELVEGIVKGDVTVLSQADPHRECQPATPGQGAGGHREVSAP